MKKRFLGLLIGMAGITMTGFYTSHAQEVDDSLQLKDVPLVIFEEGNIQPVSENTRNIADIGNVVLNYDNHVLQASLECGLENIDFSAIALPGQNTYYQGEVLLFVPENITDGYSIASCRIETSADNVTLLPFNLSYTGHTVISLAIRNDNTNDVYYIQEEIDEWPLEQMLIDAENNFSELNYTVEDLYDIELQYVTLKTDDMLFLGRNSDSVYSGEAVSNIEDGDVVYQEL